MQKVPRYQVNSHSTVHSDLTRLQKLQVQTELQIHQFFIGEQQRIAEKTSQITNKSLVMDSSD